MKRMPNVKARCKLLDNCFYSSVPVTIFTKTQYAYTA